MFAKQNFHYGIVKVKRKNITNCSSFKTQFFLLSLIQNLTSSLRFSFPTSRLRLYFFMLAIVMNPQSLYCLMLHLDQFTHPSAQYILCTLVSDSAIKIWLSINFFRSEKNLRLLPNSYIFNRLFNRCFRNVTGSSLSDAPGYHLNSVYIIAFMVNTDIHLVLDLGYVTNEYWFFQSWSIINII